MSASNRVFPDDLVERDGADEAALAQQIWDWLRHRRAPAAAAARVQEKPVLKRRVLAAAAL